MERAIAAFGLVAVLILAAATAFATDARAEPIGSKTLWEVTTKGITSPARYYRFSQEIVEYDPTCRSATRTGQSTYVDNVLEGELTVSFGERKSVYKAGQTAIIPPGLTYWFGNEGRSKVRFQESIIQPDWGGPPKTLEVTPTCVGQVPIAMQTVPISQAPAAVDVTQQGAELSPGYASLRQTVTSSNVMTVISGEVTLRYEDGTVRRFVANQGGSVDPGKPVTVANEGSSPASYMVTWLAAPGTPLIAPAAGVPSSSPAPTGIRAPSTGDAGLAAD